MEQEFHLDERLEQDTFLIAEDTHLKYLLMNNAHLPWVILVPKQENIQNFTELSPPLKMILVEKIDKIAQILQNNFSPDRVNIAMLGNIVSQMHWHIVARFEDDLCWPKPVWGNLPSGKYDADKANEIIEKIKDQLVPSLEALT